MQNAEIYADLGFIFFFRIGIMWWKEMLNTGGFHSLHIFFSPEFHKITFNRTPICITYYLAVVFFIGECNIKV